MIKALWNAIFSTKSSNRQPVGAAAASLAALLMVSGCTAGGLEKMSVAQANASLVQGYQISGGDTINVVVFDEESLTGEFNVGLDGTLSLPLIGDIGAEDLTARQLSDAIARALSDGGYVIAPRVSVEVAEHRPFFILGEVQQPGEYPYVNDLTVEQAIAKAGGFTPRAARSEVVLRRADWSEPRKIKLGNVPLLIAPGDTIRVEEAFF